MRIITLLGRLLLVAAAFVSLQPAARADSGEQSWPDLMSRLQPISTPAVSILWRWDSNSEVVGFQTDSVVRINVDTKKSTVIRVHAPQGYPLYTAADCSPDGKFILWIPDVWYPPLRYAISGITGSHPRRFPLTNAERSVNWLLGSDRFAAVRTGNGRTFIDLYNPKTMTIKSLPVWLQENGSMQVGRGLSLRSSLGVNGWVGCPDERTATLYEVRNAPGALYGVTLHLIRFGHNRAVMRDVDVANIDPDFATAQNADIQLISDGSKLIWVLTDVGFGYTVVHLWLSNLDGSHAHKIGGEKVSGMTGTYQYAVSPDGRRLAVLKNGAFYVLKLPEE